MEPSRRLARLTPDLDVDFFRLHCDDNGHGACACVAWWVPTWEGWSERTAAENRALREALFARGERDGYLAFVGDVPAAWVQAGLGLSWFRLPEPTQAEIVFVVSCFPASAFANEGRPRSAPVTVLPRVPPRTRAHVSGSAPYSRASAR